MAAAQAEKAKAQKSAAELKAEARAAKAAAFDAELKRSKEAAAARAAEQKQAAESAQEAAEARAAAAKAALKKSIEQSKLSKSKFASQEALDAMAQKAQDAEAWLLAEIGRLIEGERDDVPDLAEYKRVRKSSREPD